jgi:ubiquinone/menaquinone biosynthesis C-methylase UbiE
VPVAPGPVRASRSPDRDSVQSALVEPARTAKLLPPSKAGQPWHRGSRLTTQCKRQILVHPPPTRRLAASWPNGARPSLTPLPSPSAKDSSRIVDYDSGFDYCEFWGNRDYESWVEARALQRLLPRLGHVDWFADFGGGFGRNAVHYQGVSEHAILVDYSVTQLIRAAERLGPEIQAGRLHLIRADLGRLPLVDAAVDAAMVIRVLHHMTDVQRCLTEMCRTVGKRWLVDVPIKHHALAWIRSTRTGNVRQLLTPEPIVTGSTEYPFYTFQLAAIRRCLRSAGFRSHAAASVNNFRRWDRMLPQTVVSVLRPAVYTLDLAAQRLGRGWWGPSQFLLASRAQTRSASLAALDPSLPAQLAGLARRTRCPGCRGDLTWVAAEASCTMCGRRYPLRDGFWDFTLEQATGSSRSD